VYWLTGVTNPDSSTDSWDYDLVGNRFTGYTPFVMPIQKSQSHHCLYTGGFVLFVFLKLGSTVIRGKHLKLTKPVAQISNPYSFDVIVEPKT
jgi:hypothetical protein